jgi:hypothetical protein
MFRALAIALLVPLLSGAVCGQGTTASVSDDEILRALLPNGIWPDTTQLARFRRVDEIRALKAAQVSAKGERATSIIWLAALKYHYSENRSRLVNVERACHSQPYPDYGECYSLAADRLIDLFRRGDNSLLKYLFDIWPHSDGFLSEVLGGFYSDTLASRPRVFLGVLSRRSWKQQEAISLAAGIEDGGGMDRGRLVAVRKLLSQAIRKNDRLSKVAALCLKQIDLAQKQVAENK